MHASTNAAGPVDTRRSPHARLRTLPLGSVALAEGLWAGRQATNRAVSLPHGHRMLEQAGNLHDLRLAAGLAQGSYRGPVYMDSDLYKWLEAAAYELANGPDADLERLTGDVIALLARAQLPDGYLNSHYQVLKPDQRWTNLRDDHELYCAGHLIQAAVAHHRAAGQTTLLDVARRFADNIDSVFGPGKRPGTPGHPEIEMALVELYRDTQDRRYLDLAAFFLDQRGHGILGAGRFGAAYYQDHVPVRLARTMAGHAVRQLYLTAGVTDLYLETGEPALLDALLGQWHDMTAHQLYVTGGLGARHEGEAFGEPYELPNDRAYCETCAAIASVMWNWRLLLATGQGRFADLMERTLYNAFLSGVSLDGRRYFYVNPLLSQGSLPITGRGGHERAEWHACACCPPNVMRLLASLSHYFATADSSGLQVHHYAPAAIRAELGPGRRVALGLETAYPWQGSVRLAVQEADASSWSLSLRLPAWCERPALRLNGQPVEPALDLGYALLERRWRPGDVVELDLPMDARLVEAHPRIDSTRGCLAIERGPVVYCLEGCDQEDGVNVLDLEIDPTGPLTATWRPDLLGGLVTVEAAGYAVDPSPWEGRLYRPLASGERSSRRPVRLTAIPYYAWANRVPGAMRVWIPRA